MEPALEVKRKGSRSSNSTSQACHYIQRPFEKHTQAYLTIISKLTTVVTIICQITMDTTSRQKFSTNHSPSLIVNKTLYDAISSFPRFNFIARVSHTIPGYNFERVVPRP